MRTFRLVHSHAFRPAVRAWAAMFAVLGILAGMIALAPLDADPAAAGPSVLSRLETIDPVRVLDTRGGTKPGTNAVTAVPIAGRVPANATAVVLNATVTQPDGLGYITAYSGATRPATSNANTDEVGETAANLVVVPLTTPGDARLYTTVPAHLVVDLLGWFVPAPGSTAGRYRPVAPTGARILDTRGEPTTPVLASTRTLLVAGRGGVPATGARAVALNITVTSPATAGWLQAIPTAGSTGLGASSNVNVTRPGQTVANLAIVPLGAGGQITLAGNLTSHVIVDVAGWFTDPTAPDGTDGLFTAIDPARITDTRTGQPAPAGTTRSVSTATAAGVDTSQIGAALTNLTVTQPEAAGYVTGYPGPGNPPDASNINPDKPDATVANAAIIATNGSTFTLYTSTRTHLVADLLGWFTRSSSGTAGPTEAGTVLGSEARAGGQRIRYRSVGAAGTLTNQVTLAYVPAGTPPPGGWPIMALVHGPYGMGDQCAVSNTTTRPSEVEPWLAAGFAVVFPDLEGIGADSPGDHPYLHGPGTGRSLLDAVRAARNVYGGVLSNRVVSIGFSSGGHGSLFVAEEAPVYAPELDVRGVVSLDPMSMMSIAMDNSWRGNGFVPWWVQGQRVGNPSLNLADVLRPEAIALMPLINQRCLDDAYPVFDGVAGGQPLHTNPMAVPAWAAAFRASDPGGRRTAPVLLTGATDFNADIPAIPHHWHQGYIDRACAQGTSVQFRVYAGGHMVMETPQVENDAVAWLRQQVTGPQQTGCSRTGAGA
jgi:dienelactone hydrolase